MSVKNNVIPINSKNPAMFQAQIKNTIEDMEEKLDSVISAFAQKTRKLETRMYVLDTTLKDAFSRSEAMVDVIINKELVSRQELADSLAKVKQVMQDTEDAIYDSINNLEVVDRPVQNGDVVRIMFDASEITQDGPSKIESAIKLDIIAGHVEYGTQQMKMVSQDIVDKSVGYKGNLEIDVPKEETANPFCGKKIAFDYEIQKIKAAKNVQGPIQS